MANLLQNWFSCWAFYDTIIDADIETQKAFHALFDKYLYLMMVKFGEKKNSLVGNTQNFELFGKKNG